MFALHCDFHERVEGWIRTGKDVPSEIRRAPGKRPRPRTGGNSWPAAAQSHEQRVHAISFELDGDLLRCSFPNDALSIETKWR